VAQGGTGRATGTTAYALVATGTTATGTQQSLAQGATTEILVGGGAALPVWTTATGTGAPVRATSPVLVTPTLGAASATSLTTTGDIELGHASDTTIARSAAGAVTVEGVQVMLSTSASDLTTTGYVDAGVRTVETTTDVDVTVTGSSAIHINNHASAINYTLPADPETAGGDSKCFCFRNRQAQVITITPAAGDVIELEGTDATAAEAIVSVGAVGEFICLQGFDDAGTDRWVSWGQNAAASWAEATP